MKAFKGGADMKPNCSLNAASLKWIACIAMLIDHAGMLLFPSMLWLRVIGRIAFPIFAYQIAMGAQYTKNFKKYALRLGFFALLSELPFDLVLTGRLFSFQYQSVMITLLFGLLACGLVSVIRQKLLSLRGIACMLAVLALLFAAKILNTDYGAAGVVTVLLFYVTKDVTLGKFWQLLGMGLIHSVWLAGAVISIPLFGWETTLQIQTFALLALPLIWLDDGTAGKMSRLGRKAFYLFYPVHLMVLYGMSLLLEPFLYNLKLL